MRPGGRILVQRPGLIFLDPEALLATLESSRYDCVRRSGVAIGMEPIVQWLEGFGLDQYGEAFVAAAIDMSVLPDLTEADLEKLGVLLGHRKKLLRAIDALDLPMTPQARDDLSPSAPPQPEAERRLITVMFCDLVGSTALSARLDPEDLREVIGAYHRCCAEAIGRAGGLVAKYMGDGVVAYFGYPAAHENDAERAVRAGLDLAQAVRHLNVGSELQTRIGIATGLVVVGDVLGQGSAQEQAIVGETPNLAARLQTLAEPGAVVIDAATKRLIGGLFEYADLKPASLRGFAAPVATTRVLRESAAGSRFEALRVASTPFVGRDEELALLERHWQRAKAGEGCVVLISGEPGLGKSRVVQTLVERIAHEPYTRLRWFCSPHHQDSALHPSIAQIERAAGFRRGDAAGQRLDKLELLIAEATDSPGEVMPLFAELLSIPTASRYPPLQLAPQKRKEETLRALLAQLEGLAARQPVLMLFEDAHWSDPTSIELLDLIVDRAASLRLLLIVTFRPEFRAPWTGHPHVSLLSLDRLPYRERRAMIAGVTGGKSLPREVAEQIIDRTDGVPLFVEELTKAVIESGMLSDLGGHYAVAGPVPLLAIPATLHGSLLARLDRLAPVREVAQIGAALGRQFSHELISAVASMPQSRLDGALAQLVGAELVYRRGVPPNAEYTFKHALVQDAAYQSMLKSRRAQLHARIADTLERSFPEIAEAEPERLARHLAAAALAQRAIPYWLAAGRRSFERSALKESIAQLNTGIDLLFEVRDQTARMKLEAELQSALAVTLIAVKHYSAPEVEAAFSRAYELCLRTGNTTELGPVGRGLIHVRRMRGDLAAAKAMCLELLERPSTASDHELSMILHGTLGIVLHQLCELSGSEAHFAIAHRLCTPQTRFSAALRYRSDAANHFQCWHACNLACLGYVDSALTVAREAVALARDTEHPLMIAAVLVDAAWCPTLLRDPVETASFAEEGMTLAKDHGAAFWERWARTNLAWANAMQTRAGAGVKEIREGIATARSVGTAIGVPRPFYLLSEAELASGNPNAAVEAATEGLRCVEDPAEVHHGFLLRARGDARRVLGERTQAESDYNRALAWPRERNVKWCELSAALGLARLWQADARAGQAYELLAPVYGWFAEGFDNPVLRDAKELLENLAGARDSAATSSIRRPERLN
jgi:class 3 adenylate cyclase/tetratricopeptide (TPR) repeat protein